MNRASTEPRVDHKREWAYIDANTSNQQRRKAFDRYLHHYNWHRPHSAHGGKPPMALLTGNDAARNDS